MGKLEDHPTVKAWRRRAPAPVAAATAPLDAAWLRQLCLEHGADDVGFVSIDCPDLADQRARILRVFPRTKTLICIVGRLHRDSLRSPDRAVSNLEYKRRGDFVNQVARGIAVALDAKGTRALACTAAYPMDMGSFPDDQMWIVSHKPVAVAAGLGHMGRHRLVVHPRFGAHILLGTVLVETEVSEYGVALEYDPCLECQYCVAVCPVGAVGKDGYFDFSACLTHCYRDNLGGFIDWSERLVQSRDRASYRRLIPDPEAASFWQSLVVGPSFRTSYCMAVCPAGEDVIGPYLTNRKGYLEEVVKPLQALPERVFVVPGSDAEAHVAKHFPHKTVRTVSHGVRPQTLAGFIRGAPRIFQRHRSEGLDAVYHFTFTGAEKRTATVAIKDKQIRVSEGHVGKADVAITADTETWLSILAKERNPIWAIARRKVRVKGPMRLFQHFARCFP